MPRDRARLAGLLLLASCYPGGALLEGLAEAPDDHGPRIVDDLGKTAFPLGIDGGGAYFANDPRAGASNLIFETAKEDANGNGALDPGEDTDGDGVLDHPNTWGELLGDNYAHLDPYSSVLEP